MKTHLWLLILSLSFAVSAVGQSPPPTQPAATPAPPPSTPAKLSSAELEKLLMPIALYPDAGSDRLTKMGFDRVWLLSVRQTGPAGRRISLSTPEWRKELQETVPDLSEEDIAGSVFAITGCTVHENPGGSAALARRRGLAAQLLDEDGNDLQSHGLYHDVAPWRGHVFEMKTGDTTET